MSKPFSIFCRAGAPPATLLALTLTGLTLTTAQTRAQTPTLHMKSGQVLQGTPIRAGRISVTWQLPGSSSAGMTIPNEKISHIEFTPLPDWEEALEPYASRDYENAAKLFEEFIHKNPGEAYYPAPGNLITQAQRRLLECYRRLGDEKKIAILIQQLDPALLPPDQQKLPPALRAWGASAQRDWEAAYQAAQEAAAEVTTPSEIAEIAYLHGNAARKLGKYDIALDQFTQSHSLLVGHNPVIGAAALQASAEILSGQDTPTARARLVAVLKQYANVYGGGQLWPQAPQDLKQKAGILDTKEEATKKAVTEKKKKDWLEGF